MDHDAARLTLVSIEAGGVIGQIELWFGLPQMK